MINALETQGIARSLAEPNLVALSGDTASFLAGGEYPIPVAGTLGQITVEYKKYGVGLAFTPTVLSQGLINLRIEPEVSEIDLNNSVSVANGITVPALIVRRASTTIELRDGQSFAIGGLLQNNTKNQVEQLPWLGSVPVLGTLFSSKSYQKKETDLVIIVTPRLVHPARPGDVLKTPTDKTLPPNDVDFFLLGRNEIPRKNAPKPVGRAVTPRSATCSKFPRGSHDDVPQNTFLLRWRSPRFLAAVMPTGSIRTATWTAATASGSAPATPRTPISSRKCTIRGRRTAPIRTSR